jgi:ribosomal protein L37AE/L43A
MSFFKEKKKNTQKDRPVPYTTLENKHNEKIRHILELKKQIPIKQKLLEELQQQLDALNDMKNCDLTEEQIELKLELKETIANVEKEISNIQNNSDLKQYLLNTSHMLYIYFDENESFGNKTTPKPTTHKKSVLDFFNKSIESPQQSSLKKPSPKQKINNKYKSKGDIIDKYMSIVDRNYVKKLEEQTPDEIDICKDCNEHRIFSQINSILICPKCGQEEKLLIDSDTPSYKEPPREITYFAYKKINHFNEWISQFQAKESTDIPDEVFEKIDKELKKEHYIDRTSIKPLKVRAILKKLNLAKYYEHCPYITNRITGKPAPEINDELQEKLRNMFREVQGPWNKFCPPDRSNFFSYPYIVYKFLQLLDQDQYLSYFKLLKSKEKLHEHDEVWKKICGELKWEFIKTL